MSKSFAKHETREPDILSFLVEAAEKSYLRVPEINNGKNKLKKSHLQVFITSYCVSGEMKKKNNFD